MGDSFVRSTVVGSRGVDYLLVAMGLALFGGVAVGAVSGVSLRLAAGSGSVLAAGLLAVCLCRYPR
jgi:hypothetical protein